MSSSAVLQPAPTLAPPPALSPLDTAVQAHMAHPAGGAFDGLHDAAADAACMAAAQPGSTPPLGMWDAEREHPWLYAALYGGALLLGLLGPHLLAWLQQLLRTGGAA